MTAPRSRISWSAHRHVEAPGPTLLGGYGGFEVAQTPGYDGVLGRLWLARGGTYVMANIRGGGEYGPTWHTKAMREGGHKVAEDFAAVAKDLVSAASRPSRNWGRVGGSNGGLLMGIMLTQYPECSAHWCAACHCWTCGGSTCCSPALMGGRVRRPRQPG